MTRFNETNKHTSLEKYTSHTLFSKGLRKGWCWFSVRNEFETGIDCNILTPKFFWPQQHFFRILAGLLNRGSLRTQALCLEMVLYSAGILSPTATWTHCRELPQAVSGTCLYNCLTYTCFLWVYAYAPNSTTSTGQGDIPISSTGCTCFSCSSVYLHRWIAWLTTRSRATMLQLSYED